MPQVQTQGEVLKGLCLECCGSRHQVCSEAARDEEASESGLGKTFSRVFRRTSETQGGCNPVHSTVNWEWNRKRSYCDRCLWAFQGEGEQDPVGSQLYLSQLSGGALSREQRNHSEKENEVGH